MQEVETIQTTTTDLQLTDDDKLRIGVAWEALSLNSRRAYQSAWQKINNWISEKGISIEQLTDTTLAAYLSELDTQNIAPNTLAVHFAAIKWYFSNVKGSDMMFPITTKRLKSIRRDAQGRGRGQVDGLNWADVERVCAFAESRGSLQGLRDAALIRLMSDCLLRVSEVVAVNCGHLKDKTLIVQRSKTDQQATGEALYVTTETRNAIKKYKDKAEITRGHCSEQYDAGDIYKKND